MTHMDRTAQKEKTFAIVEKFSAGKTPGSQQTTDKLCEDGIVTNADFAAVIDGSTSKGDFRFQGKTSGRTAMEILSGTILHDLPPEADMPQAVALFTESIRKCYEAHGWEKNMARQPENRLTASLVVYAAHRREVWQIGDCSCRFNGKTYSNPKPTDHVLATVRGDVLRYLLKKGHSTASLQADDLGRQWIWPYLKDQCGFQNSDEAGLFGYAVIDGFPVDLSLVRVFPLPPDTRELVLASDGYPVVRDTLDASERELSRLLATDPLCIAECPSTKGLKPGNRSFDDRSYLRIAFS